MGIAPLRRYYEAVRPSPAHQYFRPIAQRLDPVGKADLEQLRVEPVDHVVERGPTGSNREEPDGSAEGGSLRAVTRAG